MDFLECKICNISYDEEEHRPRHAPCGHELCSACIRALINGSIFECPKCRQKNKVEVPDDLPVSFGLIDVIRAFKTQTISISRKSEPLTPGTLNADVCKVHRKIIGHRCLVCIRWLCDGCLNSHTKQMGCSTISSSIAVKSMKDEHSIDTEDLLSNFEEDSNAFLSKIQEHNDNIKKITQKRKDLLQQAEEHGEEIKKIQNLYEQGKQQTDDIGNSQKHLSSTDSPYAMMDAIEVLEEMKQALRNWSITHLGTDFPPCNLRYISKALKENKNVYGEMLIKGQKMNGKLSKHEHNIYFHTFRTQAITGGSICMAFNRLQKLIPPNPTLVFMEVSLGGVVKGYVHLRLDKDLPNIREQMVQLVTGQQGHTLAGIILNKRDDESIYNSQELPFKDMLVTADSNARGNAKRCDVLGNFKRGYLEYIFFQIAAYNFPNAKIIGCIESGMDIIQECHANHSQGVVITDCGLVLEQK